MKNTPNAPHVLDRGIPFHQKLLDYGERPYWTPDGRKIAFIAKNYGDAELIDVETRAVTPLTAPFGDAGPHSFLRVLVMCTGDYILIGPEVFEDRDISRGVKSELWFLDRELKRPPQRLGRRIFEGIALSWTRPLLSYAQTDRNDPALKGSSIVRLAGIEIHDGVARLVNDRTVLTIRGGYCLEPQDFRHDDTEIISSGYKRVDGRMHDIVHGLRLADGKETIYCNEPGVYNEPEGIFPDNEHICLECGIDGFPPRDLWKMKLDGSGQRVRMTGMIDHLPWRATNSNVSPDGRWLAFMVNKDTDEYGYGRGLGLLDLEAKIRMEYDFAAMIQPVPAAAKFSDPNYFIWCGTMIRGDEGKYHLFYSRWPRNIGFDAWVTHSEVAHAVADNPLGPYRHVDLALPARGKEFWDGLCTHNPTVMKIGAKYYLYYTGNTGDGDASKGMNWIHRNNQRIGVAVADSPAGPWTRFDKPLIDVSPDADAPDALVANNPSVTQRPDGGCLMVYKAVGRKGKMPFGGPVVHLVATSDSPTGPFKKNPAPIFTRPGVHFAAEDPFIWHDGDRYRAVLKDKEGLFTGLSNWSLALLESKDGFEWNPSKHPLVSTLQIHWEDGKVQKVTRLERPQVWLENGKPAVLFCAVAESSKYESSFNIAIPLGRPAVEPSPRSDLDFARLIPSVLPKSAIFQQPGWCLWDPSVVDGRDGKFYLFYSRWPTKLGFDAWCTHAEIAWATATDAAGPYEFRGVALSARGGNFWDGHSVYNTAVVNIGGKFYLYYTGNHGTTNWAADRAIPLSSEEWWTQRNNQRIGVAVADSPSGPWRRSEKPLIDVGPGFGKTIIAVPNLVIKPEGGFRLYYKTLGEGPGKFGSGVFHFGADADSPLGPFVRHPQPMVNKNKLLPEVKQPFDFHIDDHFEWIQDGRYYAIVKDARAPFLTPHGRSLLLFESTDGRSWRPAKHSLAKDFFIHWDDGVPQRFSRLEMPKLLFEDGRPSILALAALPEDAKESFLVLVPLKGGLK